MASLNHQQFGGLTSHEHMKILQGTWQDYEGGRTGADDKPVSYGQRERGRPYGPEDFRLHDVKAFDEPDKYGQTHQVEVERGGKHRSVYNYRREDGNLNLVSD